MLLGQTRSLNSPHILFQVGGLVRSKKCLPGLYLQSAFIILYQVATPKGVKSAQTYPSNTRNKPFIPFESLFFSHKMVVN